MYNICFYRAGALIHEAQRTSRGDAELVAMDATKTRDGADVTIYRNGKALKGWHMRHVGPGAPPCGCGGFMQEGAFVHADRCGR